MHGGLIRWWLFRLTNRREESMALKGNILDNLRQRVRGMDADSRRILANKLAGRSTTNVRDAAEKTLTAWIVSEELQNSDEVIKSFAAENLPPAHRPRKYIQVSQLPKTSTGKLDREELPKLAGARLTGLGNQSMPLRRTQAERALLDIVKEVVGTDLVSMEDDFLTIGGDSFSSIRLVALARKWAWSWSHSTFWGLIRSENWHRSARIPSPIQN